MNEENLNNNLDSKDMNEEKDIQSLETKAMDPEAEKTVEDSLKEEKNQSNEPEMAKTEENETEMEVENSEKEVENSGEEEDNDYNEVEEEEDTPDYSEFTKAQLLDELREIVQSDDISRNRKHVDIIKSCFYKLRNEELSELKKLHTEAGKDIIDFEAPKDQDETYLKELLEDFRQKKAKYNAEQDKIKEENLQKKHEIIEKIKVLANGEESLQKTFEEFRSLQNEWKEIGIVPKEAARDLWSNYNMQVERFYDFIKINNELRDLDFKKNLGTKIELCEKAEKLLIEPKVVKAYKDLQKLHDTWRETGPVPKEKREEIWERFSLASKEINRKHQEYFIQKKEERENNLKTKNALCEKAEIIANQNFENVKEWNERTNEILEIQKVWKTIGMVPQQHNNTIYERFRSACNLFFDKKQEFFKQRKSEFDDNLQKKIDICVRAEAIQNDTNWNKTRDEILKLQEEWKTIGPISKKQSDDVWKRFRTACNAFFDNRDKHFKSKKEEEQKNLDLKKAVLEKIKAFKPSEDKAENLNSLQAFQGEWTQIGFVPMREKEKLQEEYKKAIKNAFEGLDMSLAGLNNVQFQKQVNEWIEAGDERKINGERQRLNQKISKLKEDIVLLENNMSFFTGSSSGSLLNNVKKKIEKTKSEKDRLLEKRKILDLALRNLKND